MSSNIVAARDVVFLPALYADRCYATKSRQLSGIQLRRGNRLKGLHRITQNRLRRTLTAWQERRYFHPPVNSVVLFFHCTRTASHKSRSVAVQRSELCHNTALRSVDIPPSRTRSPLHSENHRGSGYPDRVTPYIRLSSLLAARKFWGYSFRSVLLAC